jgi:SAM-dependent methyltransferase
MYTQDGRGDAAGHSQPTTMTQTNTRRSFRDKWVRNPGLAFAQTLREGSDIFNWILQRNGFADAGALREYLAGRERVLDAGCGNGRVTALLRRHSDPARTQVVGIDAVSAEVARENLAGEQNVDVRTQDILGDLEPLGTFDLIYCQEVLHHTRDPRGGFLNLAARLRPGGELAVYVYKQKAPAREFVDDFVRDRIGGMPYDDAMAVCRQITELGRVLSETGVKVQVPAVDVLEIPAGEYDLQRFLYHFFMKCFWNPELSYEENVVVNYDWYHPQECTRHTVEEVRQWFAEADLEVVQEHVDPYGITMRGRTR